MLLNVEVKKIFSKYRLEIIDKNYVRNVHIFEFTMQIEQYSSCHHAGVKLWLQETPQTTQFLIWNEIISHQPGAITTLLARDGNYPLHASIKPL